MWCNAGAFLLWLQQSPPIQAQQGAIDSRDRSYPADAPAGSAFALVEQLLLGAERSPPRPRPEDPVVEQAGPFLQDGLHPEALSTEQAQGGGETQLTRDEEDEEEENEDEGKQGVSDGALIDPFVLLGSQSPMEQTPPSVLAALANGFSQREKEPFEPSHKIRVDFKVNIDLLGIVPFLFFRPN